MLKINDLRAGRAGREILHGIDLVVGKGEMAVIIGPNGSGKTSILDSIFSLADISSGKIIWNKEDITSLNTYEKILRGLSYVPQGGRIFGNMSVRENLDMGAFAIKDRRIVTKRINRVYKKFSFLEKMKNVRADMLSGGQQQILAMGMALIQDPKLILFDEPSQGLSPMATQNIFKIIKDINKKGVSVLMVEQNARQAIEFMKPDRTYLVKNGRVDLEGGRGILGHSRLKGAYL